MSKLKRPQVLAGTTYKIKWIGDCGDESYYITINDINLEDGSIKPFELFFNTPNVTHYPWMVALSRMISA